MAVTSVRTLQGVTFAISCYIQIWLLGKRGPVFLNLKVPLTLVFTIGSDSCRGPVRSSSMVHQFPVLLAEIGIKDRDRMEGFINLYFFHFNTEVSYLYSI